MENAPAKRAKRAIRALQLLFLGLLIALASGCAQNHTRGEVVREDAHLAEGLQNFERRAPMNNNEISNGPGLFTGDEGGFVLFRK